LIRCAGVVLALGATALAACAHSTPPPVSWDSAEVVHVNPPTGDLDADRASILAALDQVRPGATVQFGAGTHLVGRFLDVEVPRITLLGHAEGTTIRGCDPAGFPDMAVALVECNGFNLTGGGQTVRALSFEHTWHALVLGGLTCDTGGCRPDSPPIHARTGGYLVEGNTFRESQNGIRVAGEWSEPAVIRDNQFINTYHAVVVNGMTAHIVDNLISVPDPKSVPYTRHPGGALAIMGWDTPDQAAVCDNNVIAGNRITGHPDAILVAVAPGGTCRGNAIRDDTIESHPVRFTSPSTALFVRGEADSTVVGVPIALLNGMFGDGTIEDNLIEGNRIVGASGLAIQVSRAGRNRIVNNTITGVAVRDPFPGNTLFPEPPEWGEANGSGIWISAGSDGNEIVANTLVDIASHAVVPEGDGNPVETGTPADEIAALTDRYVEFLNDEWPGGASTLFAAAATMCLGDGVLLEGRDAIIRDFFRPTVARIRGLEPTASEVVQGEQRVTVVTRYTTRFAPAPDTVRGSFSNSWARQPDGRWLIAAATFHLPGWQDDGTSAPGIRSGFFESDGLRLHYLDSGGAGVPLLFMPVRDRTAYSFMEFAERFTDRHRVLAITSRGSGQSEGELEDVFSMANAARDVVALLDTLRIDRAVVLPAWSADIGIILANLHPDLLAGLIFTNGPPAPDLFELSDADSTGTLAMQSRLFFSADGLDPDEAIQRMRARQEEAKPYRRLDRPIRVPALAFVDASGTADVEGRWERELGIARWVADDPGMFPDSASREFYRKLASDEELQESVRILYRDFVAPRHRAVEQAFANAFASGLTLAPVEATGIGYGYRDAPDIIYPHIRRFLDEVIERETRDAGQPATP
jgi:pimeloyl-ACP methyl ester carboxylesterase